MIRPETELLEIIRKNGIDFVCSLPCDRMKNLCGLIGRSLFHVPLTREEEGIGIAAGASLAGRRPALFVQSSGIGNMINALLSLTGFYQFPLPVFVSRRGVYKESIAAQVPMGQRLPNILEGAGIGFSVIDTRKDFRSISKTLPDVYAKNRIHVFMLSPALWEACDADAIPCQNLKTSCSKKITAGRAGSRKRLLPELTRYEMLEIIAPYLEGKAVVCNLGIPSKELYAIAPRPSHFYMMGSMGMATPIGLGIALSSKKEVVVIDGDGSLLMNPGSLATTAYFSPRNLTILAIDNGAYGSTGNQPTYAGACVDLELVAKGFGIQNTFKAAEGKHLLDIMRQGRRELTFVHAIALPGNRNVPNIPLPPPAIREQVVNFLSGTKKQKQKPS